MDEIVIVGKESFLRHHLIFWCEIYNIPFSVSQDGKQNIQDKKYRAVVFIENELIKEQEANAIDNCFRSNLLLLHQSLLIPTDYFIYINNYYSSFPSVEIYKEMQLMGVELVKKYSKSLHKNYTILYLYDFIGYKFSNFDYPEYYLNSIFERKRKLIITTEYEYVHFVYTPDIVNAILMVLSKIGTKEMTYHNTEEHLRYNNKGFSIVEIANDYERVNNTFFTYKYFNAKQLTAPYSGKPSTLLNNKKINKDLWVIKRQQQNDY